MSAHPSVLSLSQLPALVVTNLREWCHGPRLVFNLNGRRCCVGECAQGPGQVPTVYARRKCFCFCFIRWGGELWIKPNTCESCYTQRSGTREDTLGANVSWRPFDLRLSFVALHKTQTRSGGANVHLVADMDSSTVYSDLTAAAGSRQSMRLRRRSAAAGSFGGSGRWTVDSHKRINRKKADKSSQEDACDHVVLLLCKFSFPSSTNPWWAFIVSGSVRHLPRGSYRTKTEKERRKTPMWFWRLSTFTFGTGFVHTSGHFSRPRWWAGRHPSWIFTSGRHFFISFYLTLGPAQRCLMDGWNPCSVCRCRWHMARRVSHVVSFSRFTSCRPSWLGSFTPSTFGRLESKHHISTFKGGGAGYPRGNRCCVQRKEPLWRESPLDLTKKIYSNSREIKKKWEKKRERFLCWKHESNDMFFIPTVAHTDAVVDPSSAPPYSLSLVGGLMLLRSLSTQHHFLEPPQFYFIFFFSSYWQIDGRPVKRNRPLMLPPPLATTVWPLHLLSAHRRRMEAMVNIDMFSPLSTVLSLFDYGEVGTKWGNFFGYFRTNTEGGPLHCVTQPDIDVIKKSPPFFFLRSFV